MIDYLDKPPQRYDHVFQKNSGSREMVEDDKGEYVKFDDMDLYMFEGSQLMQQALARIAALEAALKGALSTLREIEPMVKHEYSLRRIQISEAECAKVLYPQSETAAEPNYNVPPYHLSKIVPGCQCDGCRTLKTKDESMRCAPQPWQQAEEWSCDWPGCNLKEPHAHAGLPPGRR